MTASAKLPKGTKPVEGMSDVGSKPFVEEKPTHPMPSQEFLDYLVLTYRLRFAQRSYFKGNKQEAIFNECRAKEKATDDILKTYKAEILEALGLVTKGLDLNE